MNLSLLQICDSVLSPLQSNPSSCGGGLVHVVALVLFLFLSCKQLMGESTDKSPQSPQPPSTARYGGNILIPKLVFVSTLKRHFQH